MPKILTNDGTCLGADAAGEAFCSSATDVARWWPSARAMLSYSEMVPSE